jgi:hypothetical protein
MASLAGRRKKVYAQPVICAMAQHRIKFAGVWVVVKPLFDIEITYERLQHSTDFILESAPQPKRGCMGFSDEVGLQEREGFHDKEFV